MGKNLKKIAVVPIDNRPICYDIIKDTLAIDKDIKLFLPDIKFLGGLTTKADVEKIFEFLQNLKKVDYLIISLDTLAYGGLVPSRRSSESFEKIKKRIDRLKEIASKKAKKILAFSSIMRISNNNINEEEKLYWSDWGEKIFDWSYNFHKSGIENKEIPDEILTDYKNTRKRNFEINKYYLNLAQENFFDTLIFSKDDCAQYGLNVLESLELKKIIKEKKLNNVLIKTGADEIPLSLISRALTYDNPIKINTVFLEKKSTNLISKYEDISIKDCVKAQISLANCEIDKKDYDLTLLINNFEAEQGDLVLGSTINSTKKEKAFFKIAKPSSCFHPYFIADVNNANGSDSTLIEKLFETDIDNFFGFSGYNTSANTIGSSLFCAIVKFISMHNNSYNNLAFKKAQFIRLLDDWAYQSISRKEIRESAPKFKAKLKQKEKELNKNAKLIAEFLNYYPKEIKYSLPWNRSFEIRIELFD